MLLGISNERASHRYIRRDVSMLLWMRIFGLRDSGFGLSDLDLA